MIFQDSEFSFQIRVFRRERSRIRFGQGEGRGEAEHLGSGGIKRRSFSRFLDWPKAIHNKAGVGWRLVMALYMKKYFAKNIFFEGVIIQTAEGTSPTSIRVSWRLTHPHEDLANVDGFYILYK